MSACVLFRRSGAVRLDTGTHCLRNGLLSGAPAGAFCAGAALDRVPNGGLDDALAGSLRTGRSRLFDRRLNVARYERALDIAMAPEFNVAHGFAVAFENAIRIRERGAARETQIHVPRAGRDVAEHVLHPSAEAEPDGDRVHLIDRLRGVRRLLENNLAQRQREFGDVPIIGLKETEQLRVGRTPLSQMWPARTEYTLNSMEAGGTIGILGLPDTRFLLKVPTT